MKKTPDNRQDLLDDLDNLHNLLGDESTAADDLPLLQADEVIDEEQLPLLQPLQPATPTTTSRATTAKPPKAHTSRLTDSARKAIETAPKPKPNVEDALAARINPFLEHPKVQSAKRHAADADANASQHANRPTNGQPTTRFSDSEINHLVDDVLNACLPHIEQTLRVHLTAALHQRNRRTDEST